MFILLLICIIFTWVSINLTVTNIDWLGTILFGSGIIVFGIQLIPNSAYLRLTKEGFEIKSLFKKSFYKWKDVEQFEVIDIHLNKMIVFRFSQAFEQNIKGRIFAAYLSKGFEGGLPSLYGKNAYELANILNEWKLKFSNQ